MMKIAMIGHKRIPGREGGIEVVVEELSTMLASLGNTVCVYNRHKKGFDCPREYKGVRIIDVPTIERKNTDAAVYSLIASLLALFGKYDVIHYHAIGPSIFLLIPHFFGKKTVVTVHGLNYKTPKWKGLAAKMLMLGEKITAKYADEIIVLSTEQKNYFKSKYNRDTVYIPNGTAIHEPLPPNIIKNRFGLEKGKYILFISRIVPGKGLDLLLDAYKELDCEYKLVICGGTEYVSDFYQLITEKASLDSRVIITGFVEGETLIELYSNTKLFVFPSEAEGMPMCLLEALSFNCNCLVSDIEENKEVGKQYIKTFKCRDKEDLKKQLKECINSDCEQINSREYIKNNFSWDNVVQSTISVYKRIIQ